MKERYERERFFLICSVKQIYLCHECQTVQVCWIEVSAVQRNLHLSQEGVAAEATMMPHWDQDRATEQLGAVEGVLWDDEDDDGGSGLVVNTVISWTQPLKSSPFQTDPFTPLISSAAECCCVEAQCCGTRLKPIFDRAVLICCVNINLEVPEGVATVCDRHGESTGQDGLRSGITFRVSL